MIKLLKGLLVAALVLTATAVIAMAYFNAPAESGGAERAFTINKGESAIDIARRLQEQHFVRSAIYFMVVTYFNDNLKNLKVGQYKLNGAMQTREISELLATTEPLEKNYRITIPEGFTASEIAARFDENGLCRAKDFMAFARDPQGTGINTHGAGLTNLEGFLFPETYFFNEKSTCQTMAQRMVDQFFEIFNESAQARAKEIGFTTLEAVTLASLIEDEAKVERERPLIAGVLLNRLKHDIKLQCDATVQYALPERKERLYYKDLEVDSPYNTYKNFGLPPGPICNPGRTSLNAAIHPEKSDFFFYVAKGDGSHIFSRTGDEHNRAVEQVRKNR
ncbi:MAG: endolytic transglycosylase MltG [bacterium]